jgi:hypothetical protein
MQRSRLQWASRTPISRVPLKEEGASETAAWGLDRADGARAEEAAQVGVREPSGLRRGRRILESQRGVGFGVAAFSH